MKRSKFDLKYKGKRAKVISTLHPFYGVTAICDGVHKTESGWGIVFNRPDNDKSFMVFDIDQVEWLD